MLNKTLLYHSILDPCVHGIACMLTACLIAPTQFVKVIHMETGASYYAIIRKYISEGKLTIFFAGAHIFALRQLISAVAFGIAQWLFSCLLSVWPTTNFILLVFWQSFLNGVIETIVTIHSEIKEIAANKRDLMQRKPSVSDVLTPLFIRNILGGLVPILAYEITKNMGSILLNMVTNTLLGVLLSALSMPFDLIATQNCGAQERMTCINRLKQNILVDKNIASCFKGLTMRILQIISFGIAHSLVMLWLK